MRLERALPVLPPAEQTCVCENEPIYGMSGTRFDRSSDPSHVTCWGFRDGGLTVVVR